LTTSLFANCFFVFFSDKINIWWWWTISIFFNVKLYITFDIFKILANCIWVIPHQICQKSFFTSYFLYQSNILRTSCIYFTKEHLYFFICLKYFLKKNLKKWKPWCNSKNLIKYKFYDVTPYICFVSQCFRWWKAAEMNYNIFNNIHYIYDTCLYDTCYDTYLLYMLFY